MGVVPSHVTLGDGLFGWEVGVLNRQGHLMGIHTDGDCDEKGHGANRGWTVEAIVGASPYLQSSDIAERRGR